MKKLLLAIILLAIIAAVVFGVRTLGARDETDTVGSKEAAELVDDGDESEGDAADVEAGDRPEAGTYVYTGSGSESISALGGSEHEFPEEISIVVTLDAEDDCRWTSNVVYVKQHIEERRFCSDDGEVTDLGFTREIEFFNQLQTTEYSCADEAVRLRPDAEANERWTWECTEGTASTSTYEATFLGTEELTVGGEQVEAFHTRVTSTQKGDTNGTDTSEFWLTESGLPVRFSGDLDVKTKSVLGDTRFREQFEYSLTSLVPEER